MVANLILTSFQKDVRQDQTKEESEDGHVSREIYMQNPKCNGGEIHCRPPNYGYSHCIKLPNNNPICLCLTSAFALLVLMH